MGLGGGRRRDALAIIVEQFIMCVPLGQCVGSLFETVALGMSADRTSAVLMATSIALHQPAESIALLVALVKSSLSPSTIIKLLSMFSLVGPIGVVLGSIIQREASPIVEGALVAATAGTFLYVGATEVCWGSLVLPVEFL